MRTELVTKQLQRDGAAELLRGGVPARYAQFGAFHLDLRRAEVFRNGSRIRVPGKVYQVLVALLECPGEIVTREALRARLWPADTHVNFEANVNTTVNKLRQVLEDSNDQSMYVQTIPRRGYSFIAKVEFSEKAAAGTPAQMGLKGLAPLGAAATSRFFESRRPGVWFVAGVIAMVIAAILFGAAITLYAHHGF